MKDFKKAQQLVADIFMLNGCSCCQHKDFGKVAEEAMKFFEIKWQEDKKFPVPDKAMCDRFNVIPQSSYTYKIVPEGHEFYNEGFYEIFKK